MQFESFSEFIHMGGHATFIFSVYLLTALIVVGNIVLPLRQRARFYLEQAARQKREANSAQQTVVQAEETS